MLAGVFACQRQANARDNCMANLSASAFLELVKKSGLVAEDQLTPAVDAYRNGLEGELSEDGTLLADFLIGRKLLTRWQCGLELKRFEKPAEWGERYRQQIADIRLAPSGRRADARRNGSRHIPDLSRVQRA